MVAAGTVDSLDLADVARCQVCGRPLRSALAVWAGVGPTCALRGLALQRFLADDGQLELFDIAIGGDRR